MAALTAKLKAQSYQSYFKQTSVKTFFMETGAIEETEEGSLTSKKNERAVWQKESSSKYGFNATVVSKHQTHFALYVATDSLLHVHWW